MYVRCSVSLSAFVPLRPPTSCCWRTALSLDSVPLLISICTVRMSRVSFCTRRNLRARVVARRVGCDDPVQEASGRVLMG